MVSYQVAKNGFSFDLDEVIELYQESTLGERRPIEDRERWHSVLAQSNLVVTAWDDDRLVGIARSLSDFGYATYLCDLAVRQSHQCRGIGKELIRITHRECHPARLILLAAPKAVDYYPHIGMTPHPSCWTLDAGQPIR